MSDEPIDLYAVLGLDASATQVQIRRAFRGLLRRHHPDTRALQDQAQSRGSDEALQRILSAYAVLGDPDGRAGYDQQAGPGGPPPVPRPRPPQPRPRPERWPGLPPIQAGPVHWHRP
jgi:curved DNA-binding protein CbpA